MGIQKLPKPTAYKATGLQTLPTGRKRSWGRLIVYTVVLLVIAVIVVVVGIQMMIAPQRQAMQQYFNAESTAIHR